MKPLIKMKLLLFLSDKLHLPIIHSELLFYYNKESNMEYFTSCITYDMYKTSERAKSNGTSTVTTLIVIPKHAAKKKAIMDNIKYMKLIETNNIIVLERNVRDMYILSEYKINFKSHYEYEKVKMRFLGC